MNKITLLTVASFVIVIAMIAAGAWYMQAYPAPEKAIGPEYAWNTAAWTTPTPETEENDADVIGNQVYLSGLNLVIPVPADYRVESSDDSDGMAQVVLTKKDQTIYVGINWGTDGPFMGSEDVIGEEITIDNRTWTRYSSPSMPERVSWNTETKSGQLWSVLFLEVTLDSESEMRAFIRSLPI